MHAVANASSFGELSATLKAEEQQQCAERAICRCSLPPGTRLRRQQCAGQHSASRHDRAARYRVSDLVLVQYRVSRRVVAEGGSTGRQS